MVTQATLVLDCLVIQATVDILDRVFLVIRDTVD